jgi:hypothetical protein
MHGSTEVNSGSEFRGPEQEVLKLLEECAELRMTLNAISAQIGRMEKRIKNAFPIVAEQAGSRKVASRRSSKASITSEEALAEFDRIVMLAASGDNKQAERILGSKSAPDLLVIAKEIGVSFPKSKPSIRAMREGIFGRVRESILLAQHSTRG